MIKKLVIILLVMIIFSSIAYAQSILWEQDCFGIVGKTPIPNGQHVVCIEFSPTATATNTPTPTPDIPPAANISFTQTYVDVAYGDGNDKPGISQAGDMDNDGDIDIVVVGGLGLYIYENEPSGSWPRYGSLSEGFPLGPSTNAGILHDVDGDGDLDVIAGRRRSDGDNDLAWWQNPGGALMTTIWPNYTIDDNLLGGFPTDLMLVDVDQDGQVEALFNYPKGFGSARINLSWYEIPTSPTLPLWPKTDIDIGRKQGPGKGHAGLDYGDIDGDGDQDIAYSNGWYRRDGAAWTWLQVAPNSFPGVSSARLGDMDNDGDLDLVMSAGHDGIGVKYFENPSWTEHDIAPTLKNPECLDVADLDGDSDLDVVTCDIDFNNWTSQVHNLYVMTNDGGAWNIINVAPNSYPNHILSLVDVNGDGDLDVISEGAGAPIVSYYERD